MKFDTNNKLVFLVLILFLILSVSLYFLSLQGLKQYERSTKDLTNKYINNTVLSTFDDTKKVLTAQLQNAFLDEKILDSIYNKKRDDLYTYMKPIYDSIKRVTPGLEVMHFIHPNNDSFIRIHKPEAEDNNVALYKPLIVKVNKEHKVQTGFEAGKFGYYMRLIIPIFKDKDYIGLVEIGLNTKTVLEKLKNSISSDIIILVDKKAIKSKYINKIKHFYNSYAITSSTNKNLFLNLIAHKNHLLNNNNILEMNQQFYRVNQVKLKDLNGDSYLVSILNITDKRLFEKKQLILNFLIIFSILIILYFVYRNFKKTIDKQNILIDKYNKSLEKKVEDRTKELTLTNEKLNETLHHLEETKEDLVSAQKMAELGELLSLMTHEINSPLGVSIMGSSHMGDIVDDFLRIYKEDNLTQEDLESFIDNIQEIVKILNLNLNSTKNLVNSFKNIAVDQALEEKRTFNVKEYILQILLALKSKTSRRKIKISVECEDGLFLESYPGIFSQILTNLINNSLMHGFEENEEGNIKIIISNLENNIEMIYIDNGKGIPKELIHKVFDQYFTTKKGHGGTGLGLYIIKEIVTQKLNGHIEISTSEAKGTKFSIIIPNV